jgi:hypothetical protein
MPASVRSSTPIWGPLTIASSDSLRGDVRSASSRPGGQLARRPADPGRPRRNRTNGVKPVTAGTHTVDFNIFGRATAAFLGASLSVIYIPFGPTGQAPTAAELGTG